MVAAAAAAIWLIASGSAQAGGAGADLGTLQKALDDLCGMVGVTPCPKLPTVNQLVIENAALSGSSPADVRTVLSVPPGGAIDAGTAFAGNPVVSNPLAFVSPPSKPGQPLPTLPGNPQANAFLSATSNLSTTLSLAFDYRSRTNPFGAGDAVADITLPFAVTDAGGNLVRETPLTLHVTGAVTGTQIDGDLDGSGPQTYTLSQLGMSLGLDFGSGNEVLNLGVPLIGFDNLLVPAVQGHEFVTGLFGGIDPIANFLDASFADDTGGLLPAFNADLAIAFDGSTLLSVPLPAAEPSGLLLIGGALLALALVRRRTPAWRSCRFR